MYYVEVIRTLNKKRIKYAVAGGLAVVLYGYPRLTLDLDLIIDLKKDNLEKFFDTIYELGYRPKVPVKKEDFIDKKKRQDWIEKKEMVVFSFFHLRDHLKLIDIFVKEPIKFSVIEKEIKKIKVGNLVIPTVSIRHLKKLKLLSARPKDLDDLRNLKEIERLKKMEKLKEFKAFEHLQDIVKNTTPSQRFNWLEKTWNFWRQARKTLPKRIIKFQDKFREGKV